MGDARRPSIPALGLFGHHVTVCRIAVLSLALSARWLRSARLDPVTCPDIGHKGPGTCARMCDLCQFHPSSERIDRPTEPQLVRPNGLN